MPAIIYFDGTCLLCNSTVKWIIRNDPKALFRFKALQDQFPDRDSHSTIILVHNGIRYEHSAAILEIAKHLKWPWHLLTIFKWMPRRLRDQLYSMISKNRYRWFGTKDHCLMPDAEIRSRLL